MRLSNQKMDDMLGKLEPLLAHRDKVGYVAARNYRILSDNLTEYQKFKEDLVCKYGKQDCDDDGNPLPTYSLAYSDPSFKEYSEEIKQYAEIEHSVVLMTMKYGEVIGLLSGKEILSVDWMFED